MKNVYLYNEDMSGYINQNKLPYSDTSDFISGELDTSNSNFEFDDLSFNSGIKKAYKGQYYQNEIILEEDPISGGTFEFLEAGYYRIELKAHDGVTSYDLNNFNEFWHQDNTPSQFKWDEQNSKNFLYFNSEPTRFTPNSNIHQWFYSSETEIISNGYYEIYDQTLIFKDKDNNSIGIFDFSFVNSEYMEDFRIMRIKCSIDTIFYNKTFINEYFNLRINGELNASGIIIQSGYIHNYKQEEYEGVNVDISHEFYPEYQEFNKGKFIRKRYLSIDRSVFKGYLPVGAGGYIDKYIKFSNPYLPTVNYGSNSFPTNLGTLSVTVGGSLNKQNTNKKNNTYQYYEELKNVDEKPNNDIIPYLTNQNGNGSFDNGPKKLTPFQSVGITTDIFGYHKYIKSSSGYLKIEFLGPDSLSTVNASYFGIEGKTLPTELSIIQDQSISIPRNNKIKYDFVYSDDSKQIARGFRNTEGIVDTTSSYAIKYISGIDTNSGLLVSGLEESNLFTISGVNSEYPVSAYPLSEISRIKRNSDYSEEVEFKLGLESIQFFLTTEKKKFRIYFDEKYIYDEEIEAYKENNITKIKVDGNDITSEEFQDYEVSLKKASEGYPSDGYWTKIEIVYNKASWGLVRDFTAFSSKLIRLLDEEGAYWTYNAGSRTDEIFVKLNRDIWLDLSHQNQLYILYITYIKENNTINKEFSLNPLRLKLGQVPYTILRGITLSAIYLTEGEELWLDWGFSGDEDFVKKLYVNEILSVLPPTYTMYPINVWPYNQDFVDNDSIPTKVTNGGIKVDFKEVADKTVTVVNTEITGTRNKPFQVLRFKMPPQITTIKLVISFQHYTFTYHRDDLGIIDPYISETEFIPGDIIKMTFKLDKYHTILNNGLPTVEKIKSFYSSPSTYMISNYSNFLSYINELYSYNNDRIIKNEQLFTFYLLDKNFNDPHEITENTPPLFFIYNMVSTRSDLNPINNLFYNPAYNTTTTNAHRKGITQLLDEEEIKIYFIGQNSDIDLWLSPTLIKNNKLFTKTEGEIFFYKVEKSGFYAFYMSGSRCGNGGNGARGLAAGEHFIDTWLNKSDATAVTLAGAGSDFSLGGHPPSPHWDHKNPSSISPNTLIYSWGRPGADGGPGWIAGNGSSGGDGTSVIFTALLRTAYLLIGVWHFTVSIPLIDLPGLVIAGGKYSSNGGDGGKGFYRVGTGGPGGSAVTISGGGLSNSGSAGNFGSKKRVNVYNKLRNVFLKKGMILLFFVGFNGKDGEEGFNFHTNEDLVQSFEIFNIQRASNLAQKADGGGGSPGLPTLVYLLNHDDKKDFVIKVNNANYKLFFLEGLIIDELFQYYCPNSPSAWKNVGWLSAILAGFKGEIGSDADMSVVLIDVAVAIGIRWKILQIFQCALYYENADKYSGDSKRLSYIDNINTVYPKEWNINNIKIKLDSKKTFYGSPTFFETRTDEKNLALAGISPKIPQEIDYIIKDNLGNGIAINEIYSEEGEKQLIANNPNQPINSKNSVPNINYLDKILGFSDPGIILYYIDSREFKDGNPDNNYAIF
jgi:hypothetical protein